MKNKTKEKQNDAALKHDAALKRFFKFFLGKKGRFLFETYKNAGFPHGANGEGFFRWIKEQSAKTA